MDPNKQIVTALTSSLAIRQCINLIRKAKRLADLVLDELRWKIDGIFDVKYGTNTSRIVQLKDLSIGLSGTYYRMTSKLGYRSVEDGVLSNPTTESVASGTLGAIVFSWTPGKNGGPK